MIHLFSAVLDDMRNIEQKMYMIIVQLHKKLIVIYYYAFAYWIFL